MYIIASTNRIFPKFADINIVNCSFGTLRVKMDTICTNSLPVVKTLFYLFYMNLEMILEIPGIHC